MAKFDEQLQEKIIDLLECEFLSVTQICKALGIMQADILQMDKRKARF